MADQIEHGHAPPCIAVHVLYDDGKGTGSVIIWRVTSFPERKRRRLLRRLRRTFGRPWLARAGKVAVDKDGARRITEWLPDELMV